MVLGLGNSPSQVLHLAVQLAEQRLLRGQPGSGGGEGLLQPRDPLGHQLGSPPGVAAQALLRGGQQRQQAGGRHRIPRVLLPGQPLPTEPGGLQTDLSDLVAQADLPIHVAEGGARIGLTTGADRPTRQVGIQAEGLLAQLEVGHGALPEGGTGLIQDLLQSGQGLPVGGGQRATDPAGIGQRRQAPGMRDRGIGIERAGPGAQVREILNAAQQTHEQLQEFGVRGMIEGLLGDGHARQALE